MKKIAKKMLAFLLVFIVFVNGIDIRTITANARSDSGESEVIELRQENVKVYQVDENVYEAISYEFPVHYKENGVYEDIPFGVFPVEKNETEMLQTYDGNMSVASSFKVNEPLAVVENSGKRLAMSLIEDEAHQYNRSTTATISNPKNDFSTLEGALQATFNGKVTYENIAPGISLEYFIDSETLKESIIFKEKQDSYDLTFQLASNGLRPVKQEDGSLFFIDMKTNKTTFVIPAPVMWDAKGKTSEKVVFDTKNINEEVCEITIKPSKEWIESEDVTFPVTVDPTVQDATTTNASDTYIDGDSPTVGHGSSTALWVRSNRITYVKTSDFQIPENGTLVNADLHCYYYYFDYVSSGYVDVKPYALKDSFSWTEASLTYQSAYASGNFGLQTTSGGGFRTMANLGATSASPAEATFNITNISYDSANNIASKGIALKYMDTSINLSVVFKSRESAYSYRPKVTYRYRYQTEVQTEVDVRLYSIPDDLTNFGGYLDSVYSLCGRRNISVSTNDGAQSDGSVVASVFKQKLKTCKVAVVETHGGVWTNAANQNLTFISLKAQNLGETPSPEVILSDNNSQYLFGSSDVEPGSEFINSNDNFDGLKLMIFAGCKTGVGTSNLLTKIVQQGAETAIGFNDNIETEALDQWIINFFSILSGDNDESIQNCSVLYAAQKAVNSLMTEEDVVVVGNSEATWESIFE